MGRMAATQSIFTGKTRLEAHTRQTDTHSSPRKSLCTDLTLFNMDFGFVESKCRHSFTSQPWICLFLDIYICPKKKYMYIYIFFFPSSITSMVRLSIIIVQELGGKTDTSYAQGWAGNVRFGCWLPPIRSSYHSSAGDLKPSNRHRGPQGLPDGRFYLLPGLPSLHKEK